MNRYEEYLCISGIYTIMIFSENGDLCRILVANSLTEAIKKGKEHSKKDNRFYVINRVLKNSLIPDERWQVKK